MSTWTYNVYNCTLWGHWTVLDIAWITDNIAQKFKIKLATQNDS